MKISDTHHVTETGIVKRNPTFLWRRNPTTWQYKQSQLDFTSRLGKAGMRKLEGVYETLEHLRAHPSHPDRFNWMNRALKQLEQAQKFASKQEKTLKKLKKEPTGRRRLESNSLARYRLDGKVITGWDLVRLAFTTPGREANWKKKDHRQAYEELREQDQRFFRSRPQVLPRLEYWDPTVQEWVRRSP